MFKKLQGMKNLFPVVIALVAGLLVGSLSLLPVLASNQLSQDNTPAPIFQVNQSGEKYGSLANANYPGQEPDLVMAIGVDGTKGYLKYSDMMGKLPKNPEEAIAMQNSRQNEFPKTLPLYDVDGKTIIGEFKINNPKAIEITPETTEEDIQKVLGK